MAMFTLNGGNYGGVQIELPSGTTKVAVQSGPEEFWVYDSAIHVKTTTADFVGMVDSSDPLLAEPTTHKVDFQGV